MQWPDSRGGKARMFVTQLRALEEREGHNVQISDETIAEALCRRRKLSRVTLAAFQGSVA
ncbi:MAG: hypothetical protein LLG04_11580 [Parachlamydia sp.]|nr:hypothetical protein [Parachlamydia sp.]